MILKRAFFGLVLSAQFLVTPSALQAASRNSETQNYLLFIYRRLRASVDRHR